MVCGPFQGITGHDHHVREFVRVLARSEIRVQLRGMPLWSPQTLPFELRDPWFETLRKPVRARIALHFCMPHQVSLFPNLRNANYTMFEATPAPASWVQLGLKHDLVIVPTESSRRAWMEGGMPEARLRVCPLGIDPRLFGGSAEPLPLRLPDGGRVADRSVRFLNVSDIRHRKNLIGLLRVWIIATRPSDDAILILKLGYHGEELAAFHAEVRALQNRLGKRLAEIAPVHFLYDIYSDSEMPRFYAAATHYLSMSFGEGWDQPAMEAAASGLKLIVPKHSAYVAYLDASCAALIESREVPAVFRGSDDASPFFENARWWAPDEEAAAAHIRAAIEGRDTARESLRSRILSGFTWEKAGQRLVEILSELDQSKRRGWPFWSLRPAPISQ
jgi:glycosyltransferase involved in cell wall biosynthesis